MKAETKEMLDRYVQEGVMPSRSFLVAALADSLLRTWAMSDAADREELYDVCRYLHQEAPGECWGSDAKVARWIDKTQLERMEAEPA